jgi:hypothetical protein
MRDATDGNGTIQGSMAAVKGCFHDPLCWAVSPCARSEKRGKEASGCEVVPRSMVRCMMLWSVVARDRVQTSYSEGQGMQTFRGVKFRKR